MKTFILILLPLFSFSQEIINDSIYLVKENNTYYLISEINYSNNESVYNKKMLGDSLNTINYIVLNADNLSSLFAIHAKELIKNRYVLKDINFYNNLHQQISNRQIYVSTAIKDSIYFIGDYRLNFNGEIIDGVIELNVNKRLIFNPDNGKVYSISTNLLLSTFTNQVSFAFNGIKYDLYKYADGKFATVDGDVKLIKLE
jgi:hypothetical protein